jgi:hypothetical protein
MGEASESDDRSEPAGISWFEESRIADNAPDDSELPELDEEWYRDHWSRSQYLSAPGSEADTNRLDETESVSVNALIYEVDENDVLTDSEYEQLLETLRRQEQMRQGRGYEPSQTSGAGPSGVRRTPPVTIEEIEDKGEGPYVLVS